MNFMSKFRVLHWVYKLFNPNFRSREHEIFKKGETQVEKNLNLFTICRDLNKIRSCLECIIGNDEELMDRIKESYMKN